MILNLLYCFLISIVRENVKTHLQWNFFSIQQNYWHIRQPDDTGCVHCETWEVTYNHNY